MREMSEGEAEVVRTKAEQPTFRVIDPPERQRTYYYPDGGFITFEDVSAVAVSPRGTHRLEAKGGKYIVVPGWRYIRLDMDKWTF